MYLIKTDRNETLWLWLSLLFWSLATSSHAASEFVSKELCLVEVEIITRLSSCAVLGLFP